MSTPRFASITAGLLARKGEAQPWPDPGKALLDWDRPPMTEPARSWQPPSYASMAPQIAPQPAPPPRQAAPPPAPPMVAQQAPTFRPPVPPPMTPPPQAVSVRPAAPPVVPSPKPARAPATPVQAAAPVPASAESKKCTVRMSHHDYERLGILAIKQGKTRQRLLQEAVDHMLGGITVQFGSGCACLGTETCPPNG